MDRKTATEQMFRTAVVRSCHVSLRKLSAIFSQTLNNSHTICNIAVVFPVTTLIHWPVHGHNTSNNETVYRQTPRAGNTAKAMTSNGKERVLSTMPKIPEISVGIQMENFVSVSSDRNIRDHLWSWSTYFSRIFRLEYPTDW